MMEKMLSTEGVPQEMRKQFEVMIKERKIMARCLELAANKQRELNELAAQLNTKWEMYEATLQNKDVIVIEDSQSEEIIQIEETEEVVQLQTDEEAMEVDNKSEEQFDWEIEGLDNSQDYPWLNEEIKLMEQRDESAEKFNEQDMIPKQDQSRIATINLNGIGGVRSPFKLNRYFKSNNFDIILLQETRDFLSGCSDYFSYGSASRLKSEGSYVLINNKRYSIIKKIKESKNISVVMVEHNLAKKIFLVISIYLNPSRIDKDLKTQTKEAIRYLKNLIKYACEKNIKVLVGGDCNQYLWEIRNFLKCFGIKWSKFKTTRRKTGKSIATGKETDILASNIGWENFKLHSPIWSSDHFMLYTDFMLIEQEELSVNLSRSLVTNFLQDNREEYLRQILNIEDIHEIRDWITFNLWRHKKIQQRANRALIFIEEFKEQTLKEKVKLYFNPEDPSERRERKSPKMNQEKWDFILNNLRDNSNQPRVIGIQIGDRIVTDPGELTEIINNWGNIKWGEDLVENLGNLKMIKSLTQDLDKEKIISWIEKGLKRCEFEFPFKTTFDPDLIVPELLQRAKRAKDSNPYMKALIDFIRGLLFTNIELPEETFSARLFLLSTNESATPALEKWRPICIQNIVVRLIEKAIHCHLKWWKWSTLKMANYQTGFQEWISVHVNILRALRLLKTINKRRKDSLFLVDLTSAYDTIPRRVILEAIYEMKNDRLLWEKWNQLWAFVSQLFKESRIYHSYLYDMKFDRKAGTFIQRRGVPQGGVLSPIFFNAAFDRILRSNKIVNEYIENGCLIAYADDILVYIEDDNPLICKNFTRCLLKMECK